MLYMKNTSKQNIYEQIQIEIMENYFNTQQI